MTQKSVGIDLKTVEKGKETGRDLEKKIFLVNISEPSIETRELYQSMAALMNQGDKKEVKVLEAVGCYRMGFQKLGTYIRRSFRNLHEPLLSIIKLCKQDLYNLRSPKYTNSVPQMRNTVYI